VTGGQREALARGLRFCSAERALCAFGGGNMLFLIVLVLVMYFLGLVTSYTLGGLLHILLVIAVVLFLVHIIQGRSIGEA
jgi:predicted ferric reductase